MAKSFMPKDQLHHLFIFEIANVQTGTDALSRNKHLTQVQIAEIEASHLINHST